MNGDVTIACLQLHLPPCDNVFLVCPFLTIVFDHCSGIDWGPASLPLGSSSLIDDGMACEGPQTRSDLPSYEWALMSLPLFVTPSRVPGVV